MSVFKVQLNNVKQGLLDLDPTTDTSTTYGQLGNQFTVSKQRQMWAAGPNRRYRLMSDGETFTDCNYWKQFAYPQVDYEFAFITVLTDDGSTYSDVPEENLTTVGATVTLSTNFADTVVDFVTTYGGPARYLVVQNLDASIKVTGQLNADANITFTLAAGDSMIFNQGDLLITTLKLKGASGTPQASYIASIRSECRS